MYTQCEHCKAIFHVNMREVTVAKGKLRCGECQKVFNATQSLSTQIPEAFSDEKPEKEIEEQPNKTGRDYPPPVNFRVKGIEDGVDDGLENSSEESIRETTTSKAQISQSKTKATTNKKLIFWILGALLLLLALQVLYHYRHIFTGEVRRQPEKIQMLNHNVFTHPNESGVLLISASIENTAEQAQPYPLLEVKLTNSKSNVIALRRFKPEEYLQNYSDEMLLPVKQASSIKLKIKDPGNKATRFQFNFF